MKRGFSVIAAFLVGAIMTALVVRLVNTAAREPGVTIRAIGEVGMRSLEGQRINLSDRLAPRGASWLMFFGLNHCYSCVARGLADLVLRQKRGQHCLAVAIHSRLKDVQGWVAHESFRPIFVISREAFLGHVECRSLPVILRLEKGRVTHCEYPSP